MQVIHGSREYSWHTNNCPFLQNTCPLVVGSIFVVLWLNFIVLWAYVCFFISLCCELMFAFLISLCCALLGHRTALLKANVSSNQSINQERKKERKKGGRYLILLTRNWLDHRKWALQTVLPDWAGFPHNWVVLDLIVRVRIGLGGWTKFGLVWGQFGGFQTYKLYRLID